jgi:hypothetical protein
MKQTAIDFLYERLERMIPRTALYNIDKEEYFKQAKEMERHQIENSFYKGIQEQTARALIKCEQTTPEQYYEEKFKKQQVK